MKFIRKFFPDAQLIEVLIIGAIILIVLVSIFGTAHTIDIKKACRKAGGEPVTYSQYGDPVCLAEDGVTIIPRRKFMPEGGDE